MGENDTRDMPSLDEACERLGAFIVQMMQLHHTPGLAVALTDRERLLWVSAYWVRRSCGPPSRDRSPRRRRTAVGVAAASPLSPRSRCAWTVARRLQQRGR